MTSFDTPKSYDPNMIFNMMIAGAITTLISAMSTNFTQLVMFIFNAIIDFFL